MNVSFFPTQSSNLSWCLGIFFLFLWNCAFYFFYFLLKRCASSVVSGSINILLANIASNRILYRMLLKWLLGLESKIVIGSDAIRMVKCNIEGILLCMSAGKLNGNQNDISLFSLICCIATYSMKICKIQRCCNDPRWKSKRKVPKQKRNVNPDAALKIFQKSKKIEIETPPPMYRIIDKGIKINITSKIL